MEKQRYSLRPAKGGPPKNDNTLHQGTTNYLTDNEKLFLFKNFTSRHYLIHKERHELASSETEWLSWREPLKSRLFGKWKCYAGKQ